MGFCVFEGSFRVWTHRGEAIPGRFYVQENIVNFVPDAPLPDDTTITVSLPESGISDLMTNAVSETLEYSFSTGGQLR